MDVFEGILSESELRLFDSGDYVALQNLLDDSLAAQIVAYVNATGQDPLVLDCIKSFILPTAEILYFPRMLHEEGYVETVNTLSPQVIVSTVQEPEYLKDVHNKLRFLEENFDKVTSKTPVRKRSDYDTFISRMERLVLRANMQGVELKYPDLVLRLNANRFAFYSPQDKGRSTLLGGIIRRHREWLLCLRGLDYKEYCDMKGVPVADRRKF